MKAGILTFHRASNYGAVLQTYALQTAISKFGIDCEVIDYECPHLHQMHSPLSFLYAKGLKMKLMQLAYIQVKQRRRKLFAAFVSRKLNLSSSRYIGEKELCADGKLANTYDRFIVGSDQVWNPRLTNLDSAYFLSFVEDSIKKTSYAASFGVSGLSDEVAKVIAEYLDSFSKIYVRENRGADLVNAMIGKDVPIVLDPTLLLTPQEWDKFAKKIPQDKYIIVYTIDRSPKLIDFALDLSNKTGLQVIYINDSLFRYAKIRYLSVAMPEEWVGLFASAEYVVTNSFHGMAFALNYNKEVCVGLSIDKVNHNSRLTSLLEMLGIPFDEECGINNYIDKIDWVNLNFKLDKARTESTGYLKDIFS